MLIVNQEWTKAINLNRYDAVGLNGTALVVEREGKSYVIGRYKDEEKAKQVFNNLLEDISESGALPFEESASPYWLPGE